MIPCLFFRPSPPCCAADGELEQLMRKINQSLTSFSSEVPAGEGEHTPEVNSEHALAAWKGAKVI